jgi:protein-S-isoprenylcysteine O-methyltransferase Ste14
MSGLILKPKEIPDLKRGIVIELSRPLMHLTLLLAAAGRWDWMNAWVFGVTQFALLATYVTVLYRKNPELLAVRSRIQPKTRFFDKVFLGLFVVSALGGFIFMGLDGGRYHWSSLPMWTLPLGLAVYVSAFSFILWAMAVNRHFEGSVRIQEERNHAVCTEGPYRFVRHPGYLGIFAAMFCLPMILGTAYGFFVSIWITAMLLIRTALEDRMLQRELEGYQEYAQRVRYRVVPGIW